MKKTLLLICLFLFAATLTDAHKATVAVQASGLKSTAVQEDLDVIDACPLMPEGTFNYEDEDDLNAKISEIEKYFAEHRLSKTYILYFWNMDSKSLLTKTDIGRGQMKSLTGNENKDQLLMGVGAAIAAVLCLVLLVLVDKIRKAKFLVHLIEIVCVIGALLFGILAIVLLVSLGLKYVMMVCGPALIIGALLLMLGNSSSDTSRKRAAANIEKKQDTPGKGGYSVNGKHFDNRSDAVMYVKQFSYMDESWITPDRN